MKILGFNRFKGLGLRDCFSFAHVMDGRRPFTFTKGDDDDYTVFLKVLLVFASCCAKEFTSPGS